MFFNSSTHQSMYQKNFQSIRDWHHYLNSSFILSARCESVTGIKGFLSNSRHSAYDANWSIHLQTHSSLQILACYFPILADCLVAIHLVLQATRASRNFRRHRWEFDGHKIHAFYWPYWSKYSSCWLRDDVIGCDLCSVWVDVQVFLGKRIIERFWRV